jgi:hypothetical protein
MIRLSEIPLAVSRADFTRQHPDIPINGNGKASFSETYPGGTIVYTLQFNAASAELILYVNEDFNEDSHQHLLALAREIVSLASTRGLGAPLEESKPLAWKELIESPLPETGERSIVACRARWANAKTSASLVYAWTWPGQLVLDYRESPVGVAGARLSECQPSGPCLQFRLTADFLQPCFGCAADPLQNLAWLWPFAVYRAARGRVRSRRGAATEIFSLRSHKTKGAKGQRLPMRMQQAPETGR